MENEIRYWDKDLKVWVRERPPIKLVIRGGLFNHFTFPMWAAIACIGFIVLVIVYAPALDQARPLYQAIITLGPITAFGIWYAIKRIFGT